MKAYMSPFGFTKTIDVKETLFTTLDHFVFWLYRGQCPEFSARLSLMDYARLNSFAEKYDIPDLKYDAVIRAVMRVKDGSNSVFWPICCSLVEEIYSNTRPGDHFRTLVVALYVYRVRPMHFKTVNSAHYLEEYPDFAVEVASAMGRRIAGPDTIRLDASMFTKPVSRSNSKELTGPSASLETQSDITCVPDN